LRGISLSDVASTALSNDDLLRSLPWAGGALFNARDRPDDAHCLEGTRVDILAQVMSWAATAPDGRCRMYWLSGLAGTGKSTIARTIACRCADRQRLGATFFFARGGDADLASARKFVATVAAHLAGAAPALKPLIAAAVRASPDVAALALQDQWARLVLEPLAKLADRRRRQQIFRKRQPLLQVIDVLDECDNDSDAAAVLGLLASAVKVKELWLCVFLTSRPESPVRYGFESIAAARRQHMVLHKVEPPIVNQDIYVYMAVNLRRLGKEVLGDPSWPSEESLQRLVKLAGGLFLWAVSAHRHIAEGRAVADRRLQEVLEGGKSAIAPERNLDGIYLTVLDRAITCAYVESEKTELCHLLYAVLGTMAVLEAPLDARSLSSLISSSPLNITKALYSLHSIILS
jgi:hypothetical protein